MTTRKTIHKSGQEFKTWLDQLGRKYEDTIKELAMGRYQAPDFYHLVSQGIK